MLIIYRVKNWSVKLNPFNKLKFVFRSICMYTIEIRKWYSDRSVGPCGPPAVKRTKKKNVSLKRQEATAVFKLLCAPFTLSAYVITISSGLFSVFGRRIFRGSTPVFFFGRFQIYAREPNETLGLGRVNGGVFSLSETRFSTEINRRRIIAVRGVAQTARCMCIKFRA